MSIEAQILYDSVNDIRFNFQDVTNEELSDFLTNIQEPLAEIQVSRDFSEIIEFLFIPEPSTGSGGSDFLEWKNKNNKIRKMVKTELFSLKEELEKMLVPIRHG